MQGNVIFYDVSSSSGFISGDDGVRYSFVRQQWLGQAEPYQHARVDFKADGDRAEDIILMNNYTVRSDTSRDWLTTLLLCIFLGQLGIHRFYTNHIAIGILQFLTLGGCGIWWLIDIILIVTDSYRDYEGNPLVRKL